MRSRWTCTTAACGSSSPESPTGASPGSGGASLEAELRRQQLRWKRPRAEQTIVEDSHPPARSTGLVAQREDRLAAERVARGLQRVKRVAANLRDGVRLLQACALDHEPHRLVEAHLACRESDVDGDGRRSPE